MDEILKKLDPQREGEAIRQATAEKIAFLAKPVEPSFGEALLPLFAREPIAWIRQLEIRIFKRIPFAPEFLSKIAALLSDSDPKIRHDTALFLRDLAVRLALEKREEKQKFEEILLPALKRSLVPGGEPQHATRVELYKILALGSGGLQTTTVWLAALGWGDQEALLNFAQYVQGKYPPEALASIVAALPAAAEEDTIIHLIRALNQSISKEGVVSGYPTMPEVIRALFERLSDPSENVRKEAAAVLGWRAYVAKKQKSAIPMEDEVWDKLFAIYESKLAATAAADRDQAKAALKAFPMNPDRLARLFALLNRVTDDVQKQNVIDLIGAFKTPEARAQILGMLKEGFSKLRLEAQKTVVDVAGGFCPDPEMEAALESMMEGKGLHADILMKVAEKLFSGLPTLKERLLRWMRIDPKNGRPVIDRFDLPLMHIKILESAKKLGGDVEVGRALLTLQPKVIYNDVKLKIPEILREFPGVESLPPPRIISREEVPAVLLPILDKRQAARVLFEGFALPEAFGGTTELQFGDEQQAKVAGLSAVGMEMGKGFAKKAIDDIFTGTYGEVEPTHFKITFGDDLITVAASSVEAAAAEAAPAQTAKAHH